MKQIYLIGLLFSCFLCSSQIVTIPDANFKAKLLESDQFIGIAKDLSGQYFKIDQNNDGNIQVSEALQVSYLHLPFSNISNLTGILSFTNLNYLNCSGNNLTNLTINQLISMNELDCSGNQISSLNVSQLVNLTILKCSFNQITTLNLNSLTDLEEVYCSGNLLNSLSLSNCINLQRIDCENNSLTTINLSGLNNLIRLNIYNNQLTSLNFNNLSNLKYVSCNNNQLSSLTAINTNSLIDLNCNSNLLTSLDLTGLSNLYSLECNSNLLETITLEGCISLYSFLCSNNNLTSLDLNSCFNLYSVYMQNNEISSLFIKNGSYQPVLQFSGNSLQYICCDENELADLSYINDAYPNVQINTYCSFVPGGTYYTIQGNSKIDLNNNGCDSNDLPFNYLKINRLQNSNLVGVYITNQENNYSIPVQSGNHTLTPQLENPSYFTVSPPSTTISFPSSTSPYTQNFCITSNGIKNDLEITIIPIEVARPGFDTHYKIIYKNKGNQVANGSLNFNFDETLMDLVSSNPVNIGSATNSLNWNYNNLNPFETREIDLVFNINSPMEIPAVNSDDILHYTATIVGSTDETPNDNIFTLNQIVVNSYDPNDKTCLEGTTITPSMVGQYVHYVIRFENTGTFTAQNIVVADVIDTAKFDIGTLISQHSSHNFYTRINGNKVEFIFENINLPFDDANNDGYVAFKIKTKSTLVLGNTFSNSASIYFDYNFPIVTDPATTTVAALDNQDFDFGNYLTLYPNPTKDILHFKVMNKIEVKSIKLYNILGQILMTVTNASSKSSIDVSGLTAGSYFVEVYTDKGISRSKFIKQ